MANIFLTSKCNLRCPYCFADEFVNKEYETVSIENFKKILGFVKTSPFERVGIIGGEPSLHPEFNQILNILNNDERVNHFVVFTNALEIDKYIDNIKNDKCSLLINCNSPVDIGTSRFEKLKENIKLIVKEKNNKNVNLGINLYSKDLDYSFIFDLLKLTSNNNLRFSTALPNTSKETSKDVLNDFIFMKDYLFKFFKDCYDREIVPGSDCNGIPHCILSVEEKKLLLSIRNLAVKYNIADTIESIHTCSPVIDIMPDMNAVRCFGLSKYTKVPISNFSNINNLRNYFYNKVDLYAKLSFENDKCIDCSSHYLGKCGICYTFKLNKMKWLKRYVTDNLRKV